MHKLNRLTARLSHALALLGFSGLLLLSLMVAADIVLRSVADYPLQGVNDVAAVVMAVVIAACIPQSLRLKQSIAVDVLGTWLGGRAELALRAFASAAVLLFFTLTALQFFPYAAALTESGEQTWVLKWPVGPWWYAAATLFAFAALVQLVVTINDIGTLILGTPWPAPPATGARPLSDEER